MVRFREIEAKLVQHGGGVIVLFIPLTNYWGIYPPPNPPGSTPMVTIIIKKKIFLYSLAHVLKLHYLLINYLLCVKRFMSKR